MILTVLLVDDEPLTRSHIRSQYPWRNWGYEITGEAASGAEALALCEQAVPDIALLDITMPVMDGLTLLEQLKLRFPGIQVIILTAHRDFRFAQKALQKGAIGYILKSTFNAEETKEALDRARDEIVKQRTIGENLKLQQQVIQNYRYPIRKQFLEDILTGHLAGEEEIIRKALSVGIDMKADHYIALICTVDKLHGFASRYKEEDHSLVQFSFLEIVRELLSTEFADGYEMFPASFGRCVIALKLRRSGDEWTSPDAFMLMERLNRPLEKLMQIEVSLVVSEPFPHIRQLKEQIKRLLRLHEHRYYLRKPQPIVSGQLVPFNDKLPSEYEELYESFGAAIQGEDPVQLDKWLSQLQHASLRYKPKPESVKEWFSSLIKRAEGGAEDNLTADYPVFGHSADLFESIQQLRQWVTSVWEIKAKLVRTRPEIAKAVHYIKHNLEADLSLELVAEMVELSAAYLGRIFKKDMGVSMTDYIMEQRIHLAKKHLVNGTYRNYELAEKAGFKSYSYFCTIFKKMTGLTPNEYKNSRIPVQSDTRLD
jgi:two-component system response regulator YesN